MPLLPHDPSFTVERPAGEIVYRSVDLRDKVSFIERMTGERQQWKPTKPRAPLGDTLDPREGRR